MSGPHAEEPLAIYVMGNPPPGELSDKRAERIRTTIEAHTPAKPGDACPICGYCDCEPRRLARFQYVLGPGGSVPPITGSAE